MKLPDIEMTEDLSEKINQYLRSVRQTIEWMENIESQYFSPEYIELLEKVSKIQVKEFSKYGWYLHSAMAVGELYEMIENHSESYIDSKMSTHFNNSIKRIQNELLHFHSDKANVINEAFLAHSRKMYYASTLLFLTIADGICNGALYRLKNNKIALANVMKEKFDEIPNHLEPLLTEDFVDKNNKKNKVIGNELNRNSIVHGIHNDYGTKINSLKSLSLVCFVSSFIHRG